MVRSVSEDKLYDTIEFNEFLQVRQLTTIATKSPIVTKSRIVTNREKRADAAEADTSVLFFSLTRPKPAYGRQGLDWIVGPGYTGPQLTSFDPKSVTNAGP